MVLTGVKLPPANLLSDRWFQCKIGLTPLSGPFALFCPISHHNIYRRTSSAPQDIVVQSGTKLLAQRDGQFCTVTIDTDRRSSFL